MKDVRKLVPRTPPEGLLEWAAGAKEELDEDVLLIETEWAEDFRLEVILDEWAQRKKVRAIRATCSACTESGLLWRSRDGRGDWGFLHPDSWTEGEGGAVCVDGDRTTGLYNNSHQSSRLNSTPSASAIANRFLAVRFPASDSPSSTRWICLMLTPDFWANSVCDKP